MTHKAIVFVGALLLLWGCGQKAQHKEPVEEQPHRPNIVYIMADDHAVKTISAYGDTLGRLAPTPNIDRIAKNGAIFNRSYCTNSICGPSRAVILTGKFSHINGFRMNGDRFNGDQPTLPKMLHKKGYQTAIFGKWHLYGYPQGFDYWNIIDDQGHYYNPDFIKNGDSIRIPGYATDIITDETLDWLKNKRKKDQPFFLMMHHKAPHRNWMPALRHLHKYDSITFPIPDTYFDQHKNQLAAQQQLMTIYKDMYEGHDLKLTKKLGSPELAANPWPNDFERMSPEQRKIWDAAYQPKNDAFHRANLHGKELAIYKEQRYLHEYLATVAAVDESVGKVLDYLEENGLDKNTLVIYTSDQGFYLGEKGWFDKRFMYEESFRMPLLMQFPGVIPAGKQVNALVQNIDFAPTMLDFARDSTDGKDMQGKSFKAVLTGKENDDDFREVMYYHYYDFPAFHMVKKHYGISTKRFKLMHFYDDIDTWEFYDLEKDPQELHNAIDDRSYSDIIAKMHVQLDSVQKFYKVTSKEFEKAPEKNVERTYKMFEKLRGTPMK